MQIFYAHILDYYINLTKLYFRFKNQISKWSCSHHKVSTSYTMYWFNFGMLKHSLSNSSYLLLNTKSCIVFLSSEKFLIRVQLVNRNILGLFYFRMFCLQCKLLSYFLTSYFLIPLTFLLSGKLTLNGRNVKTLRFCQLCCYIDLINLYTCCCF